MTKLKDSHFFFLWFGAAISLSEILTGTVLAPLGLVKGITVVILGHLIGTTLLVLGGVIGTKENQTAIGSTQVAFGKYGKYLFAVLNVIQLVGWTAVMFKTGGDQLRNASQGLNLLHHPVIPIIIIGAITIIWMGFGMKSLNRLNSLAVGLLLIFTVFLFIKLILHGSFHTAAGTGLSFGAGLELTIVMPISWLPVIADYNRFGHSVKGTAIGSWIGYFLGSAWMYSIGLLLALSQQSIGTFLGKTAIIALIIIILSTVTTTFLDAKSASISFLQMVPKLNEKMVSMAVGIVGLGLALWVPMSQYENFLYLIGSLFSPLYAVVLTHYFLLGKSEPIDSPSLFYWPSFLSWLIGIGVYYLFIKFNFVLGSTLPSMIITTILYLGIQGGTRTWQAKQTMMPIVKE